MDNLNEGRWLLLIHQIPPKPSYFRVKIWRRLQRLGAVAIKNSVYVLPKSNQANEDFQWVLREIVSGGGDASLCEARLIEGLSDEDVESLFHAARDADYNQIVEGTIRITEALLPGLQDNDDRRPQIEADLSRLSQRLEEVVAIDFFGTAGRELAERAVAGLEARVRSSVHGSPNSTKSSIRIEGLRGRIWVTRKGIYVDRIASAWLIRRFVDPDASFKFVVGDRYRPAKGELRFDMFEAEFTHEGNHCTFEVLIECMKLDDPALFHIAEIVHDIDIKDAKFNREEATGIDRIIAGIVLAYKEDEVRLLRGSAIFDDLYEYFRRGKR
ncbi:MAG: chromate resistance protein [Nitrospirae bacterium]|nr:chromate resistance protein [Nitrospirota bacterium]